MQAHPETDVLGTAAYLLDETGRRANIYSHPLTHDEIKDLSFLQMPFFHPSVMARRRFFDMAALYNPDYAYAEDKGMWLRGLSVGCCYANLPEPLIEYSTDGFVKSWRSIRKHGFSLLRIAKDFNIKRGFTLAFLLCAYTAAIKLKIYKPKSLR